MPKKSSAAERTLPMFDPHEMAKQSGGPEPETGPLVKKVALNEGKQGTFGYKPAKHFILPGSDRTLCEMLVKADGSNTVKDATYLGVCQACRVEASKIGAVTK
jgi:hypothetical protein